MTLNFRAFLTVLLLVLAIPVFATGKPDPEPQPPPSAQTSSSSASQASAASKSASDSSAIASGGSATARGGDAKATGGEGGSASAVGDVTVEGDSYRDRLQAPGVSAPPVYASGSCAYGWSAGVAAPGVGISGGRARPDASCDRRELARVLTPLNPALALRLLCADPLLAPIASAEDCTYVAPAPPAAVPMQAAPSNEGAEPATAAPEYVTSAQLRESLDQMLKRTVAK